MAKIKGVALISRMGLLKESFGPEALEKTLGFMKPEYRQVLESVLFSSWYEGELYKDFNQAIQKALGGKYPDIMERIGELNAEAGLKGIYRSKFKENDVRFTLSRTESFWKTFHDTGELTVELDPTANKASFKICGYELPHIESCRNLVGWARRMIELSGGKNVKAVETKCVCKGDQNCEYTVAWD